MEHVEQCCTISDNSYIGGYFVVDSLLTGTHV